MKKSFSRGVLKPSSIVLALLAAQGIGTAYAIDCSRFGSGSGSSGANIPAECIAPRTTDPRSGFDNGARLPPEQRRNDSVIQVNRADPAIIPPSPCAAGVLNWQVGGLSCSASAPAVYSGDAVTVTDNAVPNTGTASFSCDNGSYIVQGGATCNPPPPPPANCAGGIAQQWTVGGNTCEGVLSATAHAANTTVNDSTAPLTGSATYTCNNGNYTYLAGSCNAPPPPANCVATPRSWVVGGNSCDGTVPATAHSNVSTGFDSTAPTTGSAQYTCNNGVFFQTGPQASATTCNAAPPPGPAACTAGQTLTWNNGGNTCQAMSTSTSSGNTITITDGAGPATGSATYVCNNGSFSVQSSNCTTASPPAAAPCSSGQTLTWTSGGNSCQATSTGTTSGNTITISDSTAPGTGNATFLCSNGSFSPQSVTCAASTPPSAPPPPPPPPPPPAPAPVTCNYGGGVLNWGAGGACSADPGPVSRSVGGTVDLNDNVGTSIGSIRFTCQSNGTFLPSNEICNVSPPANQACTGRTVSWTVGGANCAGGIGNLADRGTAVVNSTNGTSGTAGFTCDNGSYFENPGATCAAPAPAGPVRVFGPATNPAGTSGIASGSFFGGQRFRYFFTSAFEIFTNGPTANPQIRFVSGHANEGDYGTTRENPQVAFSAVEPSKFTTFTLPTSVGSPVAIGDTAIDPAFGSARSYVMSGGCSGTSCNYQLYFAGWPATANDSVGAPFHGLCPAGSVTDFDFQGDPGSDRVVFQNAEVPFRSVQCFSRTGEPGQNNFDGFGCPAGYYTNSSYLTCHAPTGFTGPRVPALPGSMRNVSFTR